MDRIKSFTNSFNNKEFVSKNDILEHFYCKGVTNRDSIKTLIYRWSKKGYLDKVKNGVYSIAKEQKLEFVPKIDNMQKKLSKLFLSKYPELKYSVFNTDSLNNFMTHQHYSNFYVFETEADVLEEVFYLFKENKVNSFISPSDDVINKYVLTAEKPVIIKKLVSRAPLKKKDDIFIPSLEKLLVDIFSDKVTYKFLQGSEKQNIYQKAFEEYKINLTTLLNYAQRRAIKQDIINFIQNKLTDIKLPL